MRASTFAFLALFGAIAFHDRVRLPFASLMRDAQASATCVVRTSAASERVRELQSELDRLDRRSRDLDRSVKAVDQSARTLRELAGRHRDDAVRDECREVESGLERLRTLRDRTEVERVALAARLQLARAGLDDGFDHHVQRDDEPPRSSPVDALTDVERGARRISVRAR